MKSDGVKLFVDGSVNNIKRIGYGAYLLVEKETVLNVHVKQFQNTTSSKLELQSLLWALNTISKDNMVTIYTDSQSVLSLLNRRERLVESKFRSKKNKLFTNHELYKEFYTLITQLNCRFIKVNGHSPYNQKGEVDRLFGLVDKAARKALRSSI